MNRLRMGVLWAAVAAFLLELAWWYASRDFTKWVQSYYNGITGSWPTSHNGRG